MVHLDLEFGCLCPQPFANTTFLHNLIRDVMVQEA